MTLRIIGGQFKNRPLKTPKGPQTRPSLAILRKAVFDILQDFVLEAHVLDLFAGSGAIGIEALSRGAAKATFVDKDPQASHCIRENLKQFGIEENASLLKADVFQALEKMASKALLFDIIYIDPPYGLKHRDFKEPVLFSILQFLDTHTLLKKGGFVFVEEGIPPTDYPAWTHLHRISTRKFSQSTLHQFEYRY